MSTANHSTALAEVVIDQLADDGVSVVVISPGSRSGALAIAAAGHRSMDSRVVIDERSAAFHALGVARATARPVAVIATSGTAPANHFPAIVEADMSCVPLISISADRPAEMRGVGANQTIDQIGLFGSKVRSSHTIEAPDAGADANEEWRGAVRSVVTAATGDRPGPSHLNVAFREPTVPVTDDGRTRGETYSYGTPRVGRAPNGTPPFDPLPTLSPGRGLVVAGDGIYDRSRLVSAAAALGWPIVATALSGMRGLPVVMNYHRLLRHGIPQTLTPDTVVAVGAIGPDPSLEDLVAVSFTRVRIDRWGRHIDPRRNATTVVRGDVVELLDSITGRADPDWSAGWAAADAVAGEERRDLVSASDRPSGGLVASVLNDVDWGALVVASSLPIREVDAHLERSGPVFANRGASGIDGFVSTALGVASVVPRALALTGDLAFLHDSNGFLHDTEIDVTFVVVDNGGGGLFDSLPQRAHAPGYERLFVTPHRRDIAALARFHGARVATVTDGADLGRRAAEALDRPGLDVIVVPIDRDFDLETRGQLAG